MSADASNPLSRRAARGASVTATVQVARFVVQLVGIVALARLLPPESFGLVAMSSAVVGLGEVLRDFGLSSAAIQARTLSRAQASNLFWLNTAMGLVLTLIVLAVSPLLGYFYGDPRVTWITLALAATFLLNGTQVQLQVQLVRSMRFGAVAGTELLAQSTALILALIAALAGWSYWSIVVQLLAQPLMLLILRAILARWLPGRIDRSGDIRPFIRYGSSLIGTQALVYVSSNVDSVIIGAAFGAQPLGLYNRAYQALVLPLSQFLAPMTNVALPVLSQLNSQFSRFGKYLEHAQLMVAYSTGIAYAILAAGSRDLVPALLGPAWQDTAYFFAILAVGGIFQAANYSSYWVYLAMAKTASHLKYSIVARSMMIVCLLLGATAGPYGVAAGYSVSMILALPLSMMWLKISTGVNVGPISWISARSSFMALMAGSFGYLVSFSPAPTVLRLLLSCLTTVVIVLIFVWALPAYRRDLRGLLRVVSQARRPQNKEDTPS